jgi:hypothetical protein
MARKVAFAPRNLLKSEDLYDVADCHHAVWINGAKLEWICQIEPGAFVEGTY